MLANSRACSTVSKMPVPGVTGTLFSIIVFLAVALSPILRIDSADGPINLIPCFVQMSTKSALSDINPYPGCIASAPVIIAVDIIAGILK